MNNFIETYLPIFSGFYGTIWDYVDLYGESDYFGLPEDELYELIDWQEYYNTLAEEITEKILEEYQFLGYINDWEYQKLIQPKAYNFTNDSIHVKIEPNKKAIKEAILKHQDEWISYIKKRYTSYDGFMSFYSNNALSDEWDLDVCFNDEHKLGTMLEFIAYCIEGISEESIYYVVESKHLFPYTKELEPA